MKTILDYSNTGTTGTIIDATSQSPGVTQNYSVLESSNSNTISATPLLYANLKDYYDVDSLHIFNLYNVAPSGELQPKQDFFGIMNMLFNLDSPNQEPDNITFFQYKKSWRKLPIDLSKMEI